MPENKKIYMVGIIKNILVIDLPEIRRSVVCPCAWAPGQIGAFPCFSSLDEAKAFAGEAYYDRIVEFDVESPTVN